MAKAWLEDKATWLFDLAHNNLDGDAIVKGFVKHYVLLGQGIDNVLQDMHFHTHYGDSYLKSVAFSLRTELENLIGAPPRSEMRTLEEVEMIGQAVRAGQQVQVDYYNSENNDDSYVSRVNW